MTPIDYTILGAYLLFLLALGPVFNRFNKNPSDYFRAGGSMVWWIAGSAVVMGNFSAWSFTGGAARVYETGLFFLVLFACNVVAMAFTYRFLAARFRQMRVVTPVEAIRKRFGAANEQVFTWIQVPLGVFYAGLGLYSLAVFMAGAFGLDMVHLMIAVGLVVTVMCVAGGAWAVNAGQFVQSLVFLAITGVMVFTTLSHPQIGGLASLFRQMPARHFDWSLFARPSILVVFVGTLLLNQLVQMNTLKEGAAKFLIVKNGRDAKRATLLGMICMLGLTPLWMIPAMGAVVVFPDLAVGYPALKNPHEAAYVSMAQATLPSGLLGLLVCAIFSASLDNLSSWVNVSAAVLVRNFYIRVVNPAASEQRQLWMGRLLNVAGGVGMIGVAMLLGRFSNLPLYNLVLLSAAAVGLPQAVPMFLGLFVRRAPTWAPWTTLIVGFGTSLALQLTLGAPLLNRIWVGAGGTPLAPGEVNDLKVAVITGVLLVVCVGWFMLAALVARWAEAKVRRGRGADGIAPALVPAPAAQGSGGIASADGARTDAPAQLGLPDARRSGLALLCDSPRRRAEVDAFFAEMDTPIDVAAEHAEHGGEYDSDERQYRVLGVLSLAFGGFIAAMALLPNTAAGRAGLAACGGAVAAVGAALMLLARRSAARRRRDVRVPVTPSEAALLGGSHS